jgi:hypothetical protein
MVKRQLALGAAAGGKLSGQPPGRRRFQNAS